MSGKLPEDSVIITRKKVRRINSVMFMARAVGKRTWGTEPHEETPPPKSQEFASPLSSALPPSEAISLKGSSRAHSKAQRCNYHKFPKILGEFDPQGWSLWVVPPNAHSALQNKGCG